MRCLLFRQSDERQFHLEYCVCCSGQAGHGLFHSPRRGASEVIYCVGRLGVVFDYYNREQRFYHRHTADIISMAVHPSQPYVATGQVSIMLGARMSVMDCA